MKRLTVIACASLRRELELLAAEAGPAIRFQHLDMGLHQRSAEALHAALQAAIDASEDDAVALAYGLCNRGVIGLRARKVPVVVPRAHDCIGLLLGSSARYLQELEGAPGTYFQSAGWLDQAPTDSAIRQPDFTFGPNSNVTRERLVERYGEDNADYLLGKFEDFTQHYERLAYIATPAPEAAFWQAAAQSLADRRQWRFERLEGDLGWLRRLLNGDWNSREFVTLAPGERLALTCDERLIAAEPG
ncbi:MAG: DUF1638 domain-containing protein [Rhizomicrobium sp.]|nr:DUF1638 domain-containing protein [Rhizomicrobium sp.]